MPNYQGPFSGRYYCSKCGDAASGDPCYRCRIAELEQQLEDEICIREVVGQQVVELRTAVEQVVAAWEKSPNEAGGAIARGIAKQALKEGE